MAWTIDERTEFATSLITIPPGMGRLQVHAYYDEEEVGAVVEVVDVETRTTPFTLDLDPGDYTLNATYEEVTKTDTATVVEGEVTRVDFKFKAPPKRPFPTKLVAAGSAAIVALGIAASVPKRKRV